MRQSFVQKPAYEEGEFREERAAVTNAKLAVLILATFGLIVAIYAMRYISAHSARP